MPSSTKQQIAQALETLAEKKNIDKITIRDIVEECHISRQAFYYHFRDILDVIEWRMNEITQEMLERSLEIEDPQKACRLFVSHAVENRGMLHRLMTSQHRDELTRIMMQAFRTYLHKLFRRRLSDSSLSAMDLELVTDFCAFGISGLILDHCQQPRTDTEYLADQIYRLLSGQIVNMENRVYKNAEV